jgi:REP element-mobilizing transposase RayT
MIRGIERRRIVEDEQDRRDFVLRLGKLASETSTSIYAWALLSNHAHILLSSGPLGLAKFMRRFLTGYAVSYNLRHHRHGHVFQNRYKSIVCDGDSYFTELVRYIHLNPLRVKLVKDLKGLEHYPYCGHGAILGTVKNDWQDRHSVLAQFGSRAGDAQGGYRRFVEEGVALGRRAELVGGGLVRSVGGWSEVKSQPGEKTRSCLMSGYWGAGSS